MDPEAARKHTSSPETFSFDNRDVIIFNLGVGARACNPRWIYESADDFQTFPTFVIAPMMLSSSLNSWPGIAFDLTRVVHGEQYIEILDELPTSGTLETTASVPDILDKGSGALILTDAIVKNKDTGKPVAFLQMATFQIGAGRFGGPKKSPAEHPGVSPPDRQPDVSTEEAIPRSQAALYRLGSRDMNPLHVDPDFAALGGFDAPILHGMCTLGFSVRHVINAFAKGDGRLVKAIKARFTAPVPLGSTIVTYMWRVGDRVHFQTRLKNGTKPVISHAYVDLKNDNSKL